MKTIWIINEYAGAPAYGMELRHYYISKELARKNYNVFIITASFSHLLSTPKDLKKDYELEKIDGVNYVWIKTLKYKNAHSLKRILKWFQFSTRLYFLQFKKFIERPDFIIASSPEILHLVPSFLLSKKFKSKFIFEVRDIWPLSLIEVGSLKNKNPLIFLMKKIERFAYKNADCVVSLLPNIESYLIENKVHVKKLVLIPNGIDKKEYDNIEKLDNKITSLIPGNRFIVTYAGTFGAANALEYLLKAASLLKDYKDIHFILVGKGMEENNLKELAKNLKLNNISFIPPVSKSQVQGILKLCNVCYIGWKKEKIYKYGISANKIFDYMYSEKPILHSYSGKADLIKQANCGITVEAENPEVIADAILKLYNMPEEQRNILGKNGKEYVLKYHTFEKLAEKFEEILV